MQNNNNDFIPTYVVIYKKQEILVSCAKDNEFSTKEDWEKNGYFMPSYSILEGEKIPTSKVFIKDDEVDILCYKKPSFPIRLFKICSNCHSKKVKKNGKTVSGYQRWFCSSCGQTKSGNKNGRPLKNSQNFKN